MTKETVGKVSGDLLLNASPLDHSAHEQMSEQLQDYEANVLDAVKKGQKSFVGDFFVVVITKKEKLMQNVLRNYFFSRSSCPSPDWDQAVYHYKRAKEELEFLWVIPSKMVCRMFKEYALQIDKSESALRDFVLSFEDGTLLKKSKELNGEQESSLFLR